ncbi:MAG: hypothetical protein AAF682_12810 [Planctomycetota bacterium]
MKRPTSLLAVLALGAPLGAQTPIPLVEEGDAVFGVGTVTSVFALAINNQGEWLVEVDTNHPSTDEDGAVLRDGVLYLREGDPLPAPAGALIDNFDSVQLNESGDTCWNLGLANTTGIFDNSGLYFNTTLLAQEGTAPPIAGLSAGTTFVGFFDARTANDGSSLLIASVDDPAIASTVDRALVIVTGTDAASLTLTSIWAEGQTLPGTPGPILDFSTGPHDYAYNNSGQAMFTARMDVVSDFDRVTFIDSTEIAREGLPSPVAGRDWSDLGLARLDLNDAGSYVLRGSISGDTSTNTLISKDGAKFRQEGDTLAAIAPFQFTSFGSGPVYIDNLGRVFWYGDWDDPDTDVDTGLFVDDTLLVQEGVTTVGGKVIDTLRGVQDGYAQSDDGRYLLFEAVLDDGTEGAYLIEIGSGSIQPMSDCTSPAGVLAYVSGAAALGDAFSLSMTNGQAPGVFPFLGFATAAVPGWPPCGLVLPPFGELLVDVTAPNPVLVLTGGAWTGAPTVFNVAVPAQPGLLGETLYVQGMFADLAGLSGEPFRVTGGLQLDVGL